MYQLQTGDMGPVSLVACHQQRVALPPTASISVLGKKLGTDPRISQPACCGLCQEPFFSGAVALSIDVDDFVKGCYALTA
jgi:hypothetical protein